MAAVTYRMVVGEPPFGTGPVEEIATRVLCSPAPRPSTKRPSLSPAFDRWMTRGLAKHPADRFGDARELSATLSALVTPGQDDVEPDDPGLSAAVVSHADEATVYTRSVATKPRLRTVALAAVAAVLLIAAVGVWALSGKSRSEPSADFESDDVMARLTSLLESKSAPLASASTSPVDSPREQASAPAPAVRAPTGAKTRVSRPPKPSKDRARESWLDTSEF